MHACIPKKGHIGMPQCALRVIFCVPRILGTKKAYQTHLCKETENKTI